MKHTVEFWQFEEARINAGLFFERTLEVLDITDRTFYRWKSAGIVPWWALHIVELLSGDLAPFGWQDWELKNGLLFHKSLDGRYTSWSKSQVLVTAFCTCPAHNEIRKIRHGESANERVPGRFHLTGP